MEDLIEGVLRQFAEGYLKDCCGALLHRRKKKRRKRPQFEREVKWFKKKLVNEIMMMKSMNCSSPPQITITIENHFHARVDQINQ